MMMRYPCPSTTCPHFTSLHADDTTRCDNAELVGERVYTLVKIKKRPPSDVIAGAPAAATTSTTTTTNVNITTTTITSAAATTSSKYHSSLRTFLLFPRAAVELRRREGPPVRSRREKVIHLSDNKRPWDPHFRDPGIRDLGRGSVSFQQKHPTPEHTPIPGPVYVFEI
jgi:hypothetical protein